VFCGFAPTRWLMPYMVCIQGKTSVKQEKLMLSEAKLRDAKFIGYHQSKLTNIVADNVFVMIFLD